MSTHKADDEQMKLWNGPAGHAWVDTQHLLDRVLQPFEDLLIAAVFTGGPTPKAGLDVGCGTGSTTLAAARLQGTDGHTVGIDISQPMITAAKTRSERAGFRATFICADAEMHPFEPASFDTIISRFGIMFFQNATRAFANLRRAARPDAELQFVTWRSAVENPFMTAAGRAAAPLLPELPARNPDAPGQFAFADRRRIELVLQASGWIETEIRSVDVECAFPETELIRYLTRLGPVGRILEKADERTRKQVIDSVRPAFDAYVHGAEIRFAAACWLVGASAPGASAAAAG